MCNVDLIMTLTVRNLAWKKHTFHGIGEIFHFLSVEFPFSEYRLSILSTQFSVCRILGSLFRTVLSAKKISIFGARNSGGSNPVNLLLVMFAGINEMHF